MGKEAGMEGAQVYGCETLDRMRTRLREYPLSDVMLATGLPARTLKDLKNETTHTPTAATLAAIQSGLWLLQSTNTTGIAGWRDIPNSQLAGCLPGLTVDDIWELRGGKRKLSPDERAGFIAAIQDWK